MTSLYLAVLAALAVFAAHRLILVAAFWRRARARAAAPPPLPDELPHVTVQLPLFNELYVAGRLIDAAAALDWPRDRLEIQILDDSTDETRRLCAARAAALRARGHDVVHLHRRDRAGYKAGALAAGLARARGELVLVLDADFVPPPDLLRRTVGHFRDPAVGMVQVRWEHLNRDYSALTRVQAMLLDGHFVVEQQVRASSGRFFNFNGTAGIWRRAAIDDAGGWHCDTLTEDLDLSYRALLRGWRFVYLLDTAAPAELPVDINAFKAQQFRWAKGSIQVARKLLPRVLRARLPLAVKADALLHLTQNLPYLLTLALALVVVPALLAGPPTERAADLALVVGTVGTLAAYCLTSQWVVRRAHPLGVLIRLPALIAITAGICVSQARAVLEALAGRPSEFIRTPKHGIVAGGQPWRHKRYRGARTLVPLAELALALYFAAALALVLRERLWYAAPICGLFAAGFAYVGLGSILPKKQATRR